MNFIGILFNANLCIFPYGVNLHCIIMPDEGLLLIIFFRYCLNFPSGIVFDGDTSILNFGYYILNNYKNINNDKTAFILLIFRNF